MVHLKSKDRTTQLLLDMTATPPCLQAMLQRLLQLPTPLWWLVWESSILPLGFKVSEDVSVCVVQCCDTHTHTHTYTENVVLQPAIQVDPTLQVIQATPTHGGQIYTTPVRATVVPVAMAPTGHTHPHDWYKEQKLSGQATYIQSTWDTSLWMM